MFDNKLARARQLIEQRDQIDQELRALFGERPQQKRTSRRTERNDAAADQLETGNGADTADLQQ